MKFVMILLAIWLTFLNASSDFDKEILVVDKTRDDKVKIVFDEMMQYYKEEDSHSFFSFVSEERFIQDYMTFTEAIDKDFRKYETISFDKWIDKITSDGVKRYLYVKWEKTYESNEGDHARTRIGYSRFLFDEINGEYKLIELAGNHLWGESLAEWTQEVPTIPGQEVEIVATDDGGGLPDLTLDKVTCVASSNIVFYILNVGSGATTTGEIHYSTNHGHSGTVYQDLDAGDNTSAITIVAGCTSPATLTVDPDNFIDEENESNNSEIAY